MRPSTFSSLALPPGLETTQRIHHPPAFLTAWTTLNIIYCPLIILSLCLSRSLMAYLSISHFVLTFFYVPFCSFVTPFMPDFSFIIFFCALSLSLAVPVLLLRRSYHTSVMSSPSLWLCERARCMSFCSISHRLCPLSRL